PPQQPQRAPLPPAEWDSPFPPPRVDAHPQSVCPSCGTPLREGARFCAKCGASLAGPAKKFCRYCGAELRSGSRFCPKCGHEAHS
ncbi:MAG: zinc-ribbon domain-containing protein, partial [Anaerolineae bacterium]|nr:zinc-ribbon domain-containing protein [Anaerolineae bacterium]